MAIDPANAAKISQPVKSTDTSQTGEQSLTDRLAGKQTGFDPKATPASQAGALPSVEQLSANMRAATPENVAKQLSFNANGFKLLAQAYSNDPKASELFKSEQGLRAKEALAQVRGLKADIAKELKIDLPAGQEPKNMDTLTDFIAGCMKDKSDMDSLISSIQKKSAGGELDMNQVRLLQRKANGMVQKLETMTQITSLFTSGINKLMSSQV